MHGQFVSMFVLVFEFKSSWNQKPGASCAATPMTFQRPEALLPTSGQTAPGVFATGEAKNEQVYPKSQAAQLALPAPSPPQGPSNSDILEVVAPVEEVPEKQEEAPLKCLEDAKEEVKTEDGKPKACEASELLEQALLERDRDKKEKKEGRGMKRPAAARATLGKSNAVGGESKPPVLKRPAAKKPQSVKHCKGPIPSTKVRLKMFPHGCGKCRGTAGCTPSCWVQRGYRRG